MHCQHTLRDHFASAFMLVVSFTRGFSIFAMRCSTASTFSPMRRVCQTAAVPVPFVSRHLSTRLTAGSARQNCSVTGRSRSRNERSLPVVASSARANEPSLVRQTRPSWNYKLGAVYQHLLPGPLLFLPSLLQPISTIISIEGALHGHEWVHWLLSLLPVPQVQAFCLEVHKHRLSM